MITWIIKPEGWEPAFIRSSGAQFGPFAPFDSATRELHTTAQNFLLFAPMCTSVHLRAPLCGKTKKSKMVHKPHIAAHQDQLHQLAPTCINLQEKKLRGELQLAQPPG
jgi:hypothetical protein